MGPVVAAFFDANTYSYSYVVTDPQTRAAAIIDPVLDYDPAASRIATGGAERILAYVAEHQLTIDWLLETHVHADHLSAAGFLKERLGGRIGIGNRIDCVQRMFGKILNAEAEFARDGSQFDGLFADGDQFAIGTLTVDVMHTPGHTPACVSYLVGEAAFVGDTLFMPDYGTARTDFPGGDARSLYRSIQRLLALPATTTLYLCHDYGTQERQEYQGHILVTKQRTHNIHVHAGVSENAFVALRQQRDATLQAPKLLYPAVQFNMRGGTAPPAEANGQTYFKIPINSA